jgi:DNA-binding response OmpR family regulator
LAESRPQKLLIVPDGLLPDESAAALYGRSSFETRMVATADEALAIAALWGADLIIFSSVISDVGAQAFCDAVREIPRLEATKLLMVTDLIGDEEVHVSHTPISGHLVNPVDADQLLATISELLEIPLNEAPRVPVDVLAQIEDLLDDPEDSKATVNVLHLSDDGLMLEAPVHLKIGATGKAHFFLPESSAPLSLQCCVRAVLDEILLHYWVEFVDLSDESRATLQDFVRHELRMIES